MLSYYFLFFGIIYSLKERKIKKLQANDFPNVPAHEFRKWKKLQCTSIEILQWTTFGAFPLVWLSNRGGFFTSIICESVVLMFLLASAVNGSAAAKIKKKYRFDEKRPHIPTNFDVPNQSSKSSDLSLIETPMTTAGTETGQ